MSREYQMADATNTYYGFARAKNILDTQGRADAKGKIVILITDGAQDAGPPAKIESVALQKEGAIIFVIGVGREIKVRAARSPARPRTSTRPRTSASDDLEPASAAGAGRVSRARVSARSRMACPFAARALRARRCETPRAVEDAPSPCWPQRVRATALPQVNELQSWVSQPVDQHYFAVSAFDQLDKILKQIVANACPHS